MTIAISKSEIQELLSPKAKLFSPGDEGYEVAIARWSKGSEKQAGLVIVVATIPDVQAAVKWAAGKYDLAIKGGGHSPNGASSTEGGIVVDLANLKDITVDPETRTFRVQGGATWAVVDPALAEHGLATVGGTISHTGIGGLILGGGYGLLQGQHGLAVDNLLEVKLVTVKGELVTANETKNIDLFWALRGAGGNMGVVVEFKLKAYPHTNVLGGALVFSIDKLKAVLDMGLKVEVSKGKATSGAFLISPPPHMQTACIAPIFYEGPEDEGREFFKPLYDLGPIADMTSYMPYHIANSANDQLVPHGLRRVMKSTPIQLPVSQEICDGVTERYFAFIKTYPNALEGVSGVLFEFQDQTKIASVPRTATAVLGRNKNQVFGMLLGYSDPTIDKEMRKWSQDTCTYVASHYPSEIKLTLPNFSLGGEQVSETYGENYPRLQKIKAIWDPTNVFDKWHPITPSLE